MKKYLGALIMLCFGALAIFRWYQSNALFYLLFAIRDLVCAYYFSKRVEIKIKASKEIALLAYFSSALPLFYLNPLHSTAFMQLLSTLLAIVGFLFVTLASLELGTSIGVAPAKRDLVSSGVYKLISHPMYVGYAIAEFGMILINPLNAFVFLFSISLYYFRANQESKILKRKPLTVMSTL